MASSPAGGEEDSDGRVGVVFELDGMAASGGLLLGRRTYQDVLGYWNAQEDSPFRDPLNNAPKYVASNTLTEPCRGPTRRCSAATSPQRSPSSRRPWATTSTSWAAVR